MWFSLGIIIFMLAISFFFSGMEIAFLSANRLKIELKQRQNLRSAQILSNFDKKTSEVLITILIGNNLALVFFTLQMDFFTSPYIERSLGIDPQQQYLFFTLLQSVFATLIVLVFAEYIPKAIFRRNSDRIVFPAAYLLNFFFYFLRLPVLFINAISKFILRYLFRFRTEERIVPLGKRELDLYIQEVIEASESSPVPDLDTDMLNNALSFRETKARDFMIPRTDMVAVPEETSIKELMDSFIDSTLSKVIIYQESLDKVLGFVHSKAMFTKPNQIKEILQPVLIVPETMPADSILAEFSEHKKSVAIVVDEFGGTAGMITMEDLVEEVFGEIEDEHDQEEIIVEEDMVKIIHEDGSLKLGARLEIDDLNEDEGLDLSLPDEEYYTTLGGLVLYYAEHIPVKGENIEIGFYTITIEEATQNRIISVKLIKKSG